MAGNTGGDLILAHWQFQINHQIKFPPKLRFNPLTTFQYCEDEHIHQIKIQAATRSKSPNIITANTVNQNCIFYSYRTIIINLQHAKKLKYLFYEFDMCKKIKMKTIKWEHENNKVGT